MFGIGFFELLVIAVVALVFVGPKKLPDFMKTAGRFFVQMRRTANDVRSTFDQVVQDAENEIRREEAEAMKALLAKNAKPVQALQASPDDGHHADGTLKAEIVEAPPAHPVEGDTPHGAQPYQPAGATAPKPASET